MKNISKTMLGAAAAVAVAGIAIAPSAVSAWGDNGGGRPGYTIKEINEGVLGDKIVFNSITDGAYKDADGKVHELGDERNFLRTRISETHNVWSSNEIVAEDGKEYVLSLYVHNNSPKGTDAIAKDVTVSFSIPGTSGNSVEVNGFISASNANPSKYWDNVIFKSADGSNFHLEYIPGTALWENNGKAAGKLSDDIIKSTGVKVGYNSLNGEIPGCYQYSGYASARVKVVYENDFTMSKQVRIKGTTEWADTVEAKIGDVVEYMIAYKNTSGVKVNDVIVVDELQENMKYVAGSTKLKNANNPNGLNVESNEIIGKGLNIGSYESGANAYILFEAEVIDETLPCDKKTKTTNWAKVFQNGKMQRDDASVVVAKVCDPTIVPEELPETGATSIVASALGAGSIVTSLGMYIASRKRM